jgi:hypothetical protein
MIRKRAGWEVLRSRRRTGARRAQDSHSV